MHAADNDLKRSRMHFRTTLLLCVYKLMEFPQCLIRPVAHDSTSSRNCLCLRIIDVFSEIN